MSLFNIFTNRVHDSGMLKEFANNECKCVQQELDLSELTWIDTSAYTRSKQKLKYGSYIAVRTRLAFDKQRDLFEGI
jgi:hypothetical protein